MKIFYIYCTILIILFSIDFANAQTEKKEDECINCHSVMGDKLQAPADLYKNDIHFSRGISCANCHGGDPTSDDIEISMSKDNGFIGVPPKKTRYMVCVNCHTNEKTMRNFGFTKNVNQYEDLKNSVHYGESVDSQGPIADCITCHSVHNIVRVNNPSSPVYPTKVVSLCGGCHSNATYMKTYNTSLPIDQVLKYKTSAHGNLNSKGDVNVAECSSCHGTHNIRHVTDPKSKVYATNVASTCSGCHSDVNLMAKYKIPTDQFALFTKSVHGVALLEKGDLSAPTCNDCHGNHGATPPDVESISKVCGSCHTLNMELFEKSVHKAAFDKEGLPECETCHGNHGIHNVFDEMLGVGEKSTCIKCHQPNDKGYNTGKLMSMMIDSLQVDEATARKILEEALQKGMNVSDASFSLKDVRQILIQSRTTLHTFDLNKFKEVVNTGFVITKAAKTDGEKAIDDYYFRRKGLAVSTLIITLLAVALYFRIRKVDKDKSKKEA